MTILASDVGGTGTRLALYEKSGSSLEPIRVETFASREHDSLASIVEGFLGSEPPVLHGACFGVAGPVVDGRSSVTNLPWVVDAKELALKLHLPSVTLVNDLELYVWAVARLGSGGSVTLQEGETASGNVALIAAGTGLGCSALLKSGDRQMALGSEGGHADFAPHGAVEAGLLGYLRIRFGHVSAERVLSGPGLVRIYEYLRDTRRGVEPSWLANQLRERDPAAVIAAAAIGGRTAICEDAVRIFLGIYGAEAGNWALRTLARGGVYLGGGIAAKLLCGPPGTPASWTEGARKVFLRAFGEKGRFRSWLESVPVRVIVDQRAALLGAASLASMNLPA
ncbi:MAG: glucokinase [Deltaproteobacteria bacterium]|nr:glucokinase [Deltaproteobacteria bacterium]